MEELKITKEKVLEAASKCETAKEILKTMFPDVFASTLPTGVLIPSFDDIKEAERYSNRYWFLIANSADENIRDRFLLNSKDYNWNIEESNGWLYLIPKRKIL